MDMPEPTAAATAFATLRTELGQCIIGQEALIDRLLIALLADGHLLVEGAPGLAKTTAIKELAARIEGDFHRVQFTPDLLPADLTGTEIYRPQTTSFEFQRGPIFHNLILADEVNRAPAKVQSAMLEAMGERQVTVGRDTYALPALFLVMATQNPIEQEGTYPLPEAQLDRFLLHVRVDYPQAAAEAAILKLARDRAREALAAPATPSRIVSQAQVFAARAAVLEMHLAPQLEEYIVQLVLARHDRARSLRTRARMARRPRLRDARGRARDRRRCAAPSRAAELRSRGRRRQFGSRRRRAARTRAVAVKSGDSRVGIRDWDKPALSNPESRIPNP
jgi:MoxR-like ATPase